MTCNNYIWAFICKYLINQDTDGKVYFNEFEWEFPQKDLRLFKFSLIVVRDPVWKLQLYCQSKFKPRYFLIHEKQAFEDPYESLWRDETTSGSKAIRHKQYFYNSTVLFTETEN